MIDFFGRFVGALAILIGAAAGIVAVTMFLGDSSRVGACIVGGVAVGMLILGGRLRQPHAASRRAERGRRGRSWRDDPASEKQKSFARELGIKFPPGISKGAQSDLITHATGK